MQIFTDGTRHQHGVWLGPGDAEEYYLTKLCGGAPFKPKEVIKNDGADPSTVNSDYSPLWPSYRVTGHTYMPYRQDTDWARRANQEMAAEAQDNFISEAARALR